jgi:hypothetical protein
LDLRAEGTDPQRPDPVGSMGETGLGPTIVWAVTCAHERGQVVRMYVVKEIVLTPASPVAVGEGVRPRDPGDWAEQTRRVLTRDLLVRAAYAPRGEARALEFRALHLNLPLVAEVAGLLGLTGEQLTDAEHAAIEGLLEAVGAFDPYGEREFADVAASYVEQRLRQYTGFLRG